MLWSDPKHPIWSLLRSVVIMGGACLMLSITASHFDSGELKAVGGVGLASVAFDIVKKLVSKEAV